MAIKIRSTNLRSVILSASGSPPPQVPVSSFTYLPTSGDVPLLVNFTDTSTNTPTSWAWDFGDGGTSTVQNPSYTYTNAGDYTISLTASNGAGPSIIPATNPISPTSSPTPTYTLNTNGPFQYFYNDPSGPPFTHGITGGLNPSEIPTNGTQVSSLKADYTTGTGTMVGDTYAHSPYFSWVCEITVGPTVSDSTLLLGLNNIDDTFDPNIVAGSSTAPWFGNDGSAYVDGVFNPPNTFVTWTTGDIIAVCTDYNSSLLVMFKNGVQFYAQQDPYIVGHLTTFTCGTFVPSTFTISSLEFTSYTGPQFIVQKLPFGQPSYPSIPYTWNPSTDQQFILNPGETITVDLAMSGYTGTVTGANFTSTSGIYTMTSVGQTGAVYQYTITNTEGSASTIPESITFSLIDEIGAIGTYTVTVNDIFT